MNHPSPSTSLTKRFKAVSVLLFAILSIGSSTGCLSMGLSAAANERPGIADVQVAELERGFWKPSESRLIICASGVTKNIRANDKPARFGWELTVKPAETRTRSGGWHIAESSSVYRKTAFHKTCDTPRTDRGWIEIPVLDLPPAVADTSGPPSSPQDDPYDRFLQFSLPPGTDAAVLTVKDNLVGLVTAETPENSPAHAVFQLKGWRKPKKKKALFLLLPVTIAADIVTSPIQLAFFLLLSSSGY